MQLTKAVLHNNNNPFIEENEKLTLQCEAWHMIIRLQGCASVHGSIKIIWSHYKGEYKKGKRKLHGSVFICIVLKVLRSVAKKEGYIYWEGVICCLSLRRIFALTAAVFFLPVIVSSSSRSFFHRWSYDNASGLFPTIAHLVWSNLLRVESCILERSKSDVHKLQTCPPLLLKVCVSKFSVGESVGRPFSWCNAHVRSISYSDGESLREHANQVI